MKLFTKIHEPALLMFFLSKREDSKGFTFGFDPSKIFSFLLIFRREIQFYYWKNYDSSLGWNFKVAFGRGAGYRVGRTFYLARKAKGGEKLNYSGIPSKKRDLRIGFTQNANLVPYSFRG